MLGNLIPSPSDGGAWVRYDTFGPPLAAYAADLTKGPITVLWKGWVDVHHLQKFFADAARVVSANEKVEKVRYRTRILSRTDRDVVDSPDAPPLGRLAQEAQFVRFECAPATSDEEPESDPFLIAWANLDEEPEEGAQESIGVYFRREDMPVIIPQIEPFVVNTAASRSFPRDPGLATIRSERTKDALQALQQDLA
jgi:hypothetical protein